MSAMERFGRMPDDHLLEVSRYMRDLHPDAASAVVAEMGRTVLLLLAPTPSRVLAMAAAATACTLIVALVSYARHREDFN